MLNGSHAFSALRDHRIKSLLQLRGALIVCEVRRFRLGRYVGPGTVNENPMRDALQTLNCRQRCRRNRP